MGKCPFCGNNIDDDTLYCRCCGKRIYREKIVDNEKYRKRKRWAAVIAVFGAVLILVVSVMYKQQEINGSEAYSSMSANDFAAIVFVVAAEIGVVVFALLRKPKKLKYSMDIPKEDTYGLLPAVAPDPIEGNFRHVNGLGFAENTPCEVVSYPTFYEFKAGAVNYNLSKSKVIDVTVKTDREIQQQYVSSIGGAVAGGVLFGPLGAIIGGRAKKKAIKTYSSYLIITYKDNGNIKYIGFDVTNAPFKAKKFESEFKKNNNTITRVDL